MKIIYYNKKIKLDAKKVSFFAKFIGLMFKSSNTENLLFEFKDNSKAGLHSFFVFFPFLVLWLGRGNKVVDYKVCLPFRWRISTEKPFVKVIELPFNNKNRKIVDFFVGKERFK